jgi:molecular chaperone GrpE
MSGSQNNMQGFSDADKQNLDGIAESLRGQTTDTIDNSEIEKLELEVVELKDKLARSVAEAENTRKRFQQQLSENSKFAVSDFAKSLTDVFENFYRLVSNTPAKADIKEFDSFVSGVKLTHQNLEKTLQQFGIERIYPLEQKFDHNLHQVVTQLEDDAEPGTIVQVVSAGYLLNGRILKEALVAVSKGR